MPRRPPGGVPNSTAGSSSSSPAPRIISDGGDRNDEASLRAGAADTRTTSWSGVSTDGVWAVAGYEDVNDAERLARGPVMSAIVGREGLYHAAASSSQIGRFEAEWLTSDTNLETPRDTSGARIHRFHNCRSPSALPSTWTAPRALHAAIKKAWSGTVTSAAPVTTRWSCSINHQRLPKCGAATAIPG